MKNQLVLKEEVGKEPEDNSSMKKAIDLKNISMPILNIVGNRDDLVSPNSSIPITKEIDNSFILRQEKRLIEFPSDHV